MLTALEIIDGELYFDKSFLNSEHSQNVYQQLLTEVDWRQDSIQMFGRRIAIPRLQAFQGEPGIQYRYSGLTLSTTTWHPVLLKIKQQLEQLSDHRFNSVLLNYYRTGKDSMGWHSDDEPELGQNPTIASLSLGNDRRFLLRHRFNKSIPQQELLLNSGSVLIMAGSLQHNWQHSLPKTAKAMQGRISLTFRHTYNQ